MTPEQAPSAAAWTAEDAASWLTLADSRERALAPVLPRLLAAAALRPGERVLDVGCGTGPTTAAAARLVAPGGTVAAIDVAPELIAEARRRVPEPRITWLVGDAERYPLPDFGYDVVISRFGVMFFADPYAAFANLWRATRLGGRLALAVWAPRPENPYLRLPLAAVERVLDRRGVAYEPVPLYRGGQPWGEVDFVVRLLNRTGWIEVDVATAEAELPVALPGVSPAEAATTLLAGGGSTALLSGQPPEVHREAADELAAELASRVGAEGITLPGRFRIIAARH